MRLSALLIAVFMFLFCAVQAQRIQYGLVKGTVLDSTSRNPVEAATVSLFLLKDSSLVNYALTSRKGEFLLKNIPVEEECHLLISYNGLQSHSLLFRISAEKPDTSFPPILLGKEVKELEEVMVVGMRPPMVIKKDTIEFNAGSFKTMPNAVLEDLVKLLPGIDMDKDGNLTMHGKRIEKITIDGKDFFGNDPKMALKNLPRNIIDKIQIADNKTREAQFNKITTGEENKVLNLTLKKDQNQGWFGRIYGAPGSKERYDAGGNLNLFNTKKQISFITSGNNTNRSSVGQGSFGISSAQSSLGGGGGGFTDNKTGGLNVSNVFSKTLTVASSYFYNRSSFTNSTKTQRQYILSEDEMSIYDYNSMNNNASTSNSHRVNLSIDYKPDSMTNIYLNSGFGINNARSESVNDASSLSKTGILLNTSVNSLAGNTGGENFAGELFIGRRFKKDGRSISLNLSYGADNSESQDLNIGNIWTQKEGGTDSSSLLDQRGNTSNKSNGYGLNFGYTEPLNKEITVLFRYSHRINKGNSNKYTSRFNDGTKEYDIIDSALTDKFTTRTELGQPDISISYVKDSRFRISTGIGVQWMKQDNASRVQGEINQRFTNFFPNASIAWQLGKTGELSLFYNGGSQQPSVQQLLPVPDNSNPLYIVMGNPDLRPAFSHNFNLSVRRSKGSFYWYGIAGFATTTKQIVTETHFDDLRRQVSRPLNMSGNYSTSIRNTISKTWKMREFTIRLNTSAGASFTNSTARIDKQDVQTKTYGLNGRIFLAVTFNDLFNIMPSYSVRYNDARYSITQNQAASSITHNTTIDFFVNWPRRVIIENNINYLYNSRIASGFKKGIINWNAAANCQLFRNKAGMIRFAIYDILRQNTSVERSITQNYIQDVQMDVLQQYYLLSFLYTIQKFVVKKR